MKLKVETNEQMNIGEYCAKELLNRERIITTSERKRSWHCSPFKYQVMQSITHPESVFKITF